MKMIQKRQMQILFYIPTEEQHYPLSCVILSEYADDIHPYATFELNPTMDRRRSSSNNQGQWTNQNVLVYFLAITVQLTSLYSNSATGIMCPIFFAMHAQYQQDNIRVNLKQPSGKQSRTQAKPEESEEYDSYGSDTDTERDPVHPGANRSSIRKWRIGSIFSSNSRTQDAN